MKILIVDDSMTSRMLFKVYMPKDGQHELFEAAVLPDALEKMREVQPELVILDYNMPEHNGVEMAQAMLGAGFKTKFVLLTANTQRTVVDAALAAGFIQVVEKPVNAAKIAALLAQVA